MQTSTHHEPGIVLARGIHTIQIDLGYCPFLVLHELRGDGSHCGGTEPPDYATVETTPTGFVATIHVNSDSAEFFFKIS